MASETFDLESLQKVSAGTIPEVQGNLTLYRSAKYVVPHRKDEEFLKFLKGTSAKLLRHEICSWYKGPDDSYTAYWNIYEGKKKKEVCKIVPKDFVNHLHGDKPRKVKQASKASCQNALDEDGVPEYDSRFFKKETTAAAAAPESSTSWINVSKSHEKAISALFSKVDINDKKNIIDSTMKNFDYMCMNPTKTRMAVTYTAEVMKQLRKDFAVMLKKKEVDPPKPVPPPKPVDLAKPVAPSKKRKDDAPSQPPPQPKKREVVIESPPPPKQNTVVIESPPLPKRQEIVIESSPPKQEIVIENQEIAPVRKNIMLSSMGIVFNEIRLEKIRAGTYHPTKATICTAQAIALFFQTHTNFERVHSRYEFQIIYRMAVDGETIIREESCRSNDECRQRHFIKPEIPIGSVIPTRSAQSIDQSLELIKSYSPEIFENTMQAFEFLCPYRNPEYYNYVFLPALV